MISFTLTTTKKGVCKEGQPLFLGLLAVERLSSHKLSLNFRTAISSYTSVAVSVVTRCVNYVVSPFIGLTAVQMAEVLMEVCILFNLTGLLYSTILSSLS
jgi:hypothetical protein